MEAKIEAQVVPKTVVVGVDARDVFVLVLVPGSLVDAEICGRTSTEWVDSAIAGFTHRKQQIQKNDDIMTIVKNSVIDKKYCLVVYADTPLLTRESIDQTLSFAATYDFKAVQMPRGWVFETEHIKKATNIEPMKIPNLPDEDFIVAYNYSQVALIGTYARERINSAHMAAGVNLADPYSTYIDADVKIGKGTRVGPGVVLTGESVIGKNCRIGCGVVFESFDGADKHPITLGNDVFLGAKSVLVGPLMVGDKTHIAAGSTIYQDVPANSYAMSRARQAVKEI